MGCEIRLVTVAYKSGTRLRGLLDSLKNATSRPLHVVVVDNSPVPDAAVAALCSSHGAEYRSRPDNPGFGVSNNFGSDLDDTAATEQWVLLANPDIEFPSGSIDALIAAAKTYPDAVLYGPALIDKSGKRYPTGRAFPYFSIGIGHAIFGKLWTRNPWTKRYWGTAWQKREIAEVDWISGACILVRRSDWIRLGGFDERYFMYFEDTDLGLRAGRLRGGGVKLIGNVEVIHNQGGSTTDVGGKQDLRALRAHHESALLFLNRLYGRHPLLPFIAAGLRVRRWLLSRR